MRTTLEELDLQALTEVYDTDDTFLSLYCDLRGGVDWDYFQQRERQVRKTLSAFPTVLRVFDDNLEKAKKFLELEVDPDVQGLALFLSLPNNFSELYHFPIPLEDLLVVDTSPYIRPLAWLRDEWESYLLILITEDDAELYIVSTGAILDRHDVGRDVLDKCKKRIFSRIIAQQLRHFGLNAFLKDIAKRAEELVQVHGISNLIVAGPTAVTDALKEALPETVDAKIVDTIECAPQTQISSLIAASRKSMETHEDATGDAAVEQLRKQIMTNALGVNGLTPTLRAVADGKAELVLIDKDYIAGGWKCESCQTISTGPKPERCPHCEGRVSKVDVVEEIVELAHQHEAQLEFVTANETLRSLGGIGALLCCR